jgi:protein TonB
MAKPLVSTLPAAPQSRLFKDFGVLNAGAQSKSSLATSVTINIVLAAVVIIVGAATKKTLDENHRVAMLVDPIMLKQPEPVIPKVVPLPRLPKPPVVKMEPPKITMPEAKIPEPPKIPVVRMTQPVPITPPAPPRLVTAPAAPKVVSLARPDAAAVPNNNNHPAPVALGRADNPIAVSNRPATAAVDLGNRGLAGMPSSSSGSGQRATAVSLGNGSPSGQTTSGNGTRAVAGVSLGRTGGTGPLNSTGRGVAPAGVNLGMVQQTAAPRFPTLANTPAHSGPKVIYKPRPDYTAEARSLHLEGTVSVRLHVSSTGAVTVLGVSNGLGHGLDESAERAVQATRFQPATDATGHPVDWNGVVNVVFQMAD